MKHKTRRLHAVTAVNDNETSGLADLDIPHPERYSLPGHWPALLHVNEVVFDAEPSIGMHPPATLTFDLSISKSNQFIFVPDCTEAVNSHKRFIRYRANKLSVYDHGCTLSYGQPENRTPPQLIEGGNTKTC